MSRKIRFPVAIAREVEKTFRKVQRDNVLPVIARVLNQYEKDQKRFDAKSDVKILTAPIILNKTEELRIERAVKKSLDRYNKNNAGQVNAQLSGVAGLKFDLNSKSVQKLVRKSINENVDLVKSVNVRARAQIRAIMNEAYVKQTATETVKTLLIRRLQVSENHAALIARDQGNKFFGALTTARHTDAGVTRYVWVTSNDERVREEHEERNGEIFSYDDPPEDGNPGQPIQCRCTASPVLEDIE